MLSFIKNLFGSKPTQLEVEVKAEVPYKVEVQPGIAIGTEAVYVIPEAVAPTMTPFPLVVEIPDKKPAKPKATPKPKAAPKPKAPAKPRAPKAK
jgi:hypothetical protein